MSAHSSPLPAPRGIPSGAGGSKVGDSLPGFALLVTQDRVNDYARAAMDFNPIHIDAEFAAKTQFGRRIAHGMLTLAFVTEMMALAFPDTWHAGGRLKVRFKAPVFPGETVTISGEITSITDSAEGPVAECRVGLKRPDGEEAVTGQAWALLGPRQWR
ncbi:MAG: transcriptional regulator [Dehalococcoidia bacterium]|nr:transcriptional regulator [Dehalococcoidia bacterium]MSQ34571.1 transcriptional regulator [Dehalococcoidia bacterium]